MENQNTLFGFLQSRNRSNNERQLNLKERKWVKQLQPKGNGIKMTEKGPPKFIECLSKLKSSNQEIIEKHKLRRYRLTKTRFTLPVIEQENSDSEEETSKTDDVDGATALEDYNSLKYSGGKPRRWTKLKQSQSLPSNFDINDAKHQDELCTVCEQSVFDTLDDDTSHVLDIFEPQNKKNKTFDNISKCSTFHKTALYVNNDDIKVNADKEANTFEDTVDEMRMSLLNLASLLQEGATSSQDEVRRRNTSQTDKIYNCSKLKLDEDKRLRIEHGEILKENSKLRMEIVSLQIKLGEKDEQMRILENLLVERS